MEKKIEELKTAQEVIKELYHFEITNDNESDDCDLSWADVVDLMNQHALQINRGVHFFQGDVK